MHAQCVGQQDCDSSSMSHDTGTLAARRRENPTPSWGTACLKFLLVRVDMGTFLPLPQV